MRRYALVLTLVAGCSTAPSGPKVETLPDLPLQPKPSNGYQMILPIVQALQPGSDTEYCTWTDVIVDHDVDVRAVQGFQTFAGHHVILFSTQKMQPAGTTRKCTDQDMATFRFAAGAGGEGQTAYTEAPGNLVFRVPAGSQFVVNHHYINASPAPRDAQSAINIHVADPSKQYVPSGAITWLDTSMRAAPGHSSLDINCKMRNDVKIWSLFPHMHEYGTRASLSHTSGDVTTTLIDVPEWVPSYTFHAPQITRDPSDPLVVKAGDLINVHCEWNNPTAEDLTFGIEMCVGFASTIDDGGVGNIACDNGSWGTF